MKKLPLIVLLFAAAACQSKNSNTAVNTADSAAVATPVANTAPATDTVVVSMEGMGDLKSEMTITEVEHVLNRKFLPPDSTALKNYDPSFSKADAWFPDTINTRYKNVDYSIWFTREQQYDDSTYQVEVLQTISRSPLLKTTAGIRIGDDVRKILKAYADSGQQITIGQRFDDTPPKPERAKEITIGGLAGPSITFFMTNHKVESMRVSFNKHVE